MTTSAPPIALVTIFTIPAFWRPAPPGLLSRIEACYGRTTKSKSAAIVSRLSDTEAGTDELKDRTFDSAYVLLPTRAHFFLPPYWHSTHLLMLLNTGFSSSLLMRPSHPISANTLCSPVPFQLSVIASLRLPIHHLFALVSNLTLGNPNDIHSDTGAENVSHSLSFC